MPSSSPDTRFPGHPKSGPPPVGDIFQGPRFLAAGALSFELHALPDMCGTFFCSFIFSSILLGVVNIIQLPANQSIHETVPKS